MKILIVDDEPLVRKSLSRAFRSQAHEVFAAQDGLQGLAMWREVKPDLVMLDVLMPGLSGPEVLREIFREPQTPTSIESLDERSSERSAKVILMSAYSGEHNMTTAKQMGASLFIPKPFADIFAVVARAEELCRG